jgi:hypothetical protein
MSSKKQSSRSAEMERQMERQREIQRKLMPRALVLRSGSAARDAPQDAQVSAVEPSFRQMNSLAPKQNLKVIQATVSQHTVVFATPFVVCLNPMLEGSDETARVGDIIRWKELCLGLELFSNTNLLLPALMRVMVIAESTALGSVLSPAQYFTSATPSPIDQRNVTTRNVKRFKTLYDSGPIVICGYTTNTATLSWGGTPDWARNIKIPLDLITDYSRGNAGTVADVETNAISLICFTDSTNAAGTYINYGYTLEGVNLK